MIMNRRLFLYVFIFVNIFFFLSACSQTVTQEQKSALLKKELGLESDAGLDYENVKHLMFLHKYPAEGDKKLSADAVALARKMIADGKSYFPVVEYSEAILSYPTPEIVLAFANGFLRVAQVRIDKKKPDLSKPMNENDLEWYFKGSAFYYNLAIDFAKKINQEFSVGQLKAINATLTCIDKTLVDPMTNVERPCELIAEHS